MTDVVVELPLRTDAEHALFGDYLTRFMQTQSSAADICEDAPFLMVHSQPTPDAEMKVVTFQERTIAGDFSRGWSEAVRTLRGALS